MIAPVNQDNVDRSIAQVLDQVQTSETTTDNHYALPSRGRSGGLDGGLICAPLSNNILGLNSASGTISTNMRACQLNRIGTEVVAKGTTYPVRQPVHLRNRHDF
jgi:hypothetical protein